MTDPSRDLVLYEMLSIKVITFIVFAEEKRSTALNIDLSKILTAV